MTIKLTEEEKRLAVTNLAMIYPIMQRILKRENKFDREREHFWIVGLNTAGVLQFVEMVALGSVSKVVVDPSSIYRVSLIKGATTVIAVHNHPGGSLKFSNEDIDLTNRLLQAGRLLNVELVDHLIISEESYISMVRDTLLFGEILKSTKYTPAYVQYDSIQKQEQEKIYRNIAKKLLSEKVHILKVAETLGIGITELERILSTNE